MQTAQPVRSSSSRARSTPTPRSPPARLLDNAIVTLALAISPALAATGSVYVDGKFNVGAGHDSFNGSFTGGSNVGLGYSVMPNLTIGADNTLIGRAALRANTQGLGNTASGYFALDAPPATTTPRPASIRSRRTRAATPTSPSAPSPCGATVRRLRAHNRREDQEIARQSMQIATLERNVARLSRP